MNLPHLDQIGPAASKHVVSIIVPVFQVEKYLDRCIRSILGQSHPEFELVLVDDGSTDTSGEICDAYAVTDRRIRVIHTTRNGLAQARNIGLAAATGDYFAFVDSDDWVHSELLERLLRVAEQTDSDIACSHWSRPPLQVVEGPKDAEVRVYSSTEALAALVGLDHTLLTVAWGKLYRRSVFDGVRFPPGRLHEDEFTTYRNIMAASRVVVTSDVLYYYWQRSSGIMGSGMSSRRARDSVDAYVERAEALESSGLEAIARQAFQEAFRKQKLAYLWLSENGDALERRRLAAEMRSLARAHPSAASTDRLASLLYLKVPSLAALLHRAYSRLGFPRLRRTGKSRAALTRRAKPTALTNTSGDAHDKSRPNL